MMGTLFNRSYLSLLAVLAVFSLMPSVGYTQFGGYGGGGIGGGGYGGFGGYGGGIGGGAGGGQGTVLVKYGEKIYDALYKDLVRYNVHYINVPADTIGVHYFDDGTHGDEVAYDGIPSNINISEEEYFGPFTIIYKDRIEKLIEVAEEMGAHEFFSVFVTAEQPDSQLRTSDDYQQQFNEVFESAKAFLDTYDEIVIRSEGLGLNAERYEKRVDPALIESLEGAGGLGGGGAGGFGGGLLLPDLPPPPGLPQPSIRGGLQPNEGLDAGVDDGSASQPQSSGRFDPIGNTNAVIDGLNTLNSP